MGFGPVGDGSTLVMPLSHGELFSSLGPSSPDDVSARCRSHSDEKAVGSFSAFIVRLKWSLHSLSPQSSLELLLKHKREGKVNNWKGG
jgi:hypothetical protein